MDILCEMRFHVPNTELEEYEEKRDAEKQKAREEAKKNGKEAEESNDDEEEMTAAKLFNNKIVKAAGIG
jgi:hypothetical protein